MVESAEDWCRVHSARCVTSRRRRIGEALLQALVGSGSVVEGDIFPQDSQQMGLVEDEPVVQALLGRTLPRRRSQQACSFGAW
jgi:hypothetical protein